MTVPATCGTALVCAAHHTTGEQPHTATGGLVHCRSLGTLSLTLSHIELAESVHAFGVITCGPHWGLTPIVADSDQPWFNWQVHMALARLYHCCPGSLLPMPLRILQCSQHHPSYLSTHSVCTAR